MRTLAIALTVLAVGAAPVAHADPVNPLQPLVDAAAQRLLTADPVAANKYLNGGQIQDPAREQQVLDTVAAAATIMGADPAYTREVFRDQIDASVAVQYSLFAHWKLDPAAVPATAPDLTATRATIDGLNQTIVSEIAAQWPTLTAPSCAADLGVAVEQVATQRALDPLHRRALVFATGDYCR